MKLGILTTDNREPYREYHKPDPWFGTAPEALLQGFSNLPPAEVHFFLHISVACPARENRVIYFSTQPLCL